MQDLIWVFKSVFLKIKIDRVVSAKAHAQDRITRLQEEIKVAREEIASLNNMVVGFAEEYDEDYFGITEQDLSILFPNKIN